MAATPGGASAGHTGGVTRDRRLVPIIGCGPFPMRTAAKYCSLFHARRFFNMSDQV